MILGRPSNLIVAALAALFNVLVAFQILGFMPSPEQIGVVNVAIFAIVAVIAGQPPTVPSGSSITVVKPNGQPNEVKTV